MPVSLVPRAIVACLGVLVGAAAIVWWAAIGLALNGSPALAQHLGVAPQALDDEKLVPRALLHPHAFSPTETARLRADAKGEPLAALPYFLLATSAAAAGHKAQASGLVDAALLRDPRSATALALKMQETYAARQFGKTADHALGLLAIRPEDPRALDFVVYLSGIPQARARIFAALERNPGWRSGYINALSATYGKTSFVYEAIQIGNPVAINLAGERAALLADLIKLHDYDRAYTAWVSWLPAEALSSIGYVYDGAFTGAPGALPFNWRFDNSDKVTTSIEPGTGLSVNVDGTVEVVPATQTILLPPGRYRLVTTLGNATAAGADTASPFVWQVKCVDQAQLIMEAAFPPTKADSKFASAAFDVPATCAAQTIELRAKPQIYPTRTVVAIKSIAIRKVP